VPRVTNKLPPMVKARHHVQPSTSHGYICTPLHPPSPLFTPIITPVIKSPHCCPLSGLPSISPDSRSNLTSPNLAQPFPNLTSPHLTSPHLTSPHLTSPHLTTPHLTSPHLTSPHLTSPHLLTFIIISASAIAGATQDHQVQAQVCRASPPRMSHPTLKLHETGRNT